MLKFEHGSKYTRPDVKERAGLPRDAKGGNWVSDARPPSGESALKGAVLWRGSEDAISSTTPVVQAGAES
jgi:hypothetical protein